MVKGFPNKSVTNINHKPLSLPCYEEMTSSIMEQNLSHSYIVEYYRGFVVIYNLNIQNNYFVGFIYLFASAFVVGVISSVINLYVMKIYRRTGLYKKFYWLNKYLKISYEQIVYVFPILLYVKIKKIRIILNSFYYYAFYILLYCLEYFE